MAINLDKIPNHKKRPHRKSDFGQAIMGLLIILAIIALPFVAVCPVDNRLLLCCDSDMRSFVKNRYGVSVDRCLWNNCRPVHSWC